MSAGQRELTPEQAAGLELLRVALTADRGRVQTLDVARRRYTVLTAAQGALAAAGEALGAAMIQVLIEEAGGTVEDLEREAAEHAAAQARKAAEALAVVAADLDGPAVTLDGGPSTLGAAEWLAEAERWAGGGR
jgi:hypothetical protein